MSSDHGITTAGVTADTTLVQDKELVFKAIGEEIVILSVSAGCCYRLNSSGAEIWNMLREPCRVSRICGELFQLYNADAATVTEEVIVFLGSLVESGLLRVLDHGSGR